MLIKLSETKLRTSENIVIHNYVTRDINASFSFSIANLQGQHPRTLNEVSDRLYYIIEGNGLATVGDERYTIEAGDAILIPKNTLHSIEGTLKYAIINSPSFNPLSERQK